MRTRSGRSYGCEECAQENQTPTHTGNLGNTYNPTDHCKRHRKPDDQPYTENVDSYRRRKPQ